jgi:hypothetical protein
VDAARSYVTPLPEAIGVLAPISFDAEGVEVDVGPPLR